MPKFYFNVRDRERVSRDPEGQELSDLLEAEFEARLAARDLLIDSIQRDRPIDDDREIEIADGDGRVLRTLKVREVLDFSSDKSDQCGRDAN